MTDPPVLDRTAVGALIGVSGYTVSRYLVDSRDGRRYAGHPFPAPNGHIGKSPWWHPDRRAEIEEWARTRVGAGTGGGRPRKDSVAPQSSGD